MRILHCCDATLLVFKWQHIPIFRSERFADSNGQTERHEVPIMFATIVRFFREWHRYNQSLRELSALGDRELADIGISRSDIQRVAWNATHHA
jgi:uncharacterized protein YjiS (DUF1127 family)